MPFTVPMIWRKPTNHSTDCYFCLTNIPGFPKKNKFRIVYPVCPLTLKPVAHDATTIPILERPSFDKDSLSEESRASTEIEGMSSDRLL